MNCKGYEELIGLHAGRDLTGTQLASVEEHLRVCANCREFADGLGENLSTLSLLSEDTATQTELATVRELVMAQVESPRALGLGLRLERFAFTRIHTGYALAGVVIVVIAMTAVTMNVQPSSDGGEGGSLDAAVSPVAGFIGSTTTTLGSTATAQIPVSAAEMAERIIDQMPPRYPLEARRARVQGRVELDVVIDDEGRVTDLSVITGHPLLAPAAAQAVGQWRYDPYTVDGQPVAVATTVNVTFTLN